MLEGVESFSIMPNDGNFSIARFTFRESEKAPYKVRKILYENGKEIETLDIEEFCDVNLAKRKAYLEAKKYAKDNRIEIQEDIDDLEKKVGSRIERIRGLVSFP